MAEHGVVSPRRHVKTRDTGRRRRVLSVSKERVDLASRYRGWYLLLRWQAWDDFGLDSDSRTGVEAWLRRDGLAANTPKTFRVAPSSASKFSEVPHQFVRAAQGADSSVSSQGEIRW